MIYFDNAATTRCGKHAISAMIKYATEFFHNPSTTYAQGMAVKNEITRARESILNALSGEGNIIYTSSGTEANNLVVFGTKKLKESRIIISANEHASIALPVNVLKQKGFDVVVCPVDEYGKVKLNEFKNALTKNTSLVSIMHVNNNTGAINEIEKLVHLAKEVDSDILFHSDGSQAFGKMHVNLKKLNVDLYTISGHKVGASKGIGGLFVKRGLNISPMMFGGGQEFGIRPSTENVPGIMGFAAAVNDFQNTIDARLTRVKAIRDRLEKGFRHIRELKILSNDDTSPYILAVASQKVRGELMQHALERKGILIATGSACSSNKMSNKVADSLGLIGNYRYGLIRISLSIENSVDESREFLDTYIKAYKEFSGYGDRERTERDRRSKSGSREL
ncbi:MAG: cysteine desulfurase [Christensenellaceae bacterium]|jgi:cysteine desulfurase|nr:cysteine desulfurase [Christensenellaceae bacterium]